MCNILLFKGNVNQFQLNNYKIDNQNYKRNYVFKILKLEMKAISNIIISFYAILIY